MKPKKTLLAFILIILIGCLGCHFLNVIRPTSYSAEERFAAFRAKQLQLPARREPICVVAVGDIMLSRGVAGEIKKHDNNQYHPFLKMESCLKCGDIVFGNLENPITPGREIMMPERTLRADPGVEAALYDAGFTVLSLANNHMEDFGRQGLLDTLQYLDKAGIRYVGAGKTSEEAFAAKYTAVKGLKLAFLAFAEPALVPDSYLAGSGQTGVAFGEPERIRAAVQEAKKKADFVVVSMHAGTEYEPVPDFAQTRLAHLSIDAGADLVLGHHPHVVQKIEKYKDKYIMYSLGNFVFDQKWSRATRIGLVARIFITSKGTEKIELLPVFINDQDQPQVLAEMEARQVLENMGLDLLEETVPYWDWKKQAFQDGKKYIHQSGKPVLERRLIKDRHFDLDQDGVCEDYSLRDGRLEIIVAGQTIWKSPDEWWVADFFLGDSDNDNIPELNLLVWKSGSFGPHKPFWVTKDDLSVKNHLFIFKLADGVIKPVWQSSNLDRPNYDAILIDLNGNGKNELVVTEGDYADPRVRQTSIWQWNGWGFSKICSGESLNG